MSFADIWTNIRTLLIGTGVTQVVVVGTTLAIGVLFSPGEFGVFIVYSTIALTIGSLAAFRYERAIVIARWSRTANAVSQVGCIVLLVTTLISAIVMSLIWFFQPFGVSGFRLYDGSAIVITIAVFGAYQIESQWLIRNGNFQRLALAEFVGPAVGAIIQVVSGLCGWLTYEALLTGFVAGRILQLAVAIGSRPSSTSISANRKRAVAAVYRSFPIVSTPYTLVSTGLNRGMLMIAAAMLPSATVGILAMAQRLTYLPVTTIASAIRRVFVRRIATGIGTEALSLETLLIFRVVLVLMIPILLFIVFLIPFGFTIIASEEWAGIEKFVILFAPAAASLLFSSWLDRIYEVKRKQYVAFWLETTSTVGICLTFYLLLRTGWSGTFATGVFSALICAYNTIWLVITLKIAKIPSVDYIKRILIIAFLLPCAVLLILYNDLVPDARLFPVASLLFVLISVYMLWEIVGISTSISLLKNQSTGVR